MSEKCRLCLADVPSGAGISIMDAQFREQIENVFRFAIVYDKHLPEYACIECLGTVSNINAYCQQVQTNQEHLRIHTWANKSQQVENIKEESLFDESSFDPEKEKIESEDLPKERVQLEFVQLNNPTVFVEEEKCNPVTSEDDEDKDEEQEADGDPKARRRGRRKKDENLKTKNKQLVEPKGELLAKQEETDKVIKDFYSLECEICSAPLESFALLLDHYREAHSTKGYVRCCDKQFFRRYMLVDHIAAHRGTIRCEICQKTYKTRRYLSLHIAKSHSREEDRPYKCSKCHVSYPKQYLLRAHEQLHVQEQCHICQKVLSNNQSLKVHIAQMHKGDGNQICATCGKVFRTKPAMERHIKEHLGLELVERLQCEYCKKWFNGKYNLKKHIRFLHKEGGQMFPCEMCQHVSPNSRALANHKQRIHVEEKFACEYCGKRFKRRPNLREHIASHTNVPLYSCEICKNRTFNSKANYFTHRKNQHPEEWETQRRLKTEREMRKH